MVKQRIAIVGLGLIGGSLARRLVNAGCEVVAWNHNDRPYETAEADGIRCVPTLAVLADAKPDVLVLCNPLKAMPQILGALKPLIDPSVTTLTDVGSVKEMVREQVRAVGLEHCYVGRTPWPAMSYPGGNRRIQRFTTVLFGPLPWMKTLNISVSVPLRQ